MKKPRSHIFKFVRHFAVQRIPVLPLVARSKRPATKQGLYDATTNSLILSLLSHLVPVTWKSPR